MFKANKIDLVISVETYYKNMKKILKSVIVYLDSLINYYYIFY